MSETQKVEPVSATEQDAIAKTSNRFDALDGLRGIAALIVVIGHFWPYQEFKSLPFINVFMDTKLPVAVFFVLSGVVLTHSAKRANISFSWLSFVIVARYLRLLVPILSISVLVYFLHLSDFIYVDRIPGEYRAWDGFARFYQFELGALDVLRFSLVDVFFNYDAGHTYIPPAWTMRPELFASTLLFIFLFVVSWKVFAKIPVLVFLVPAVLVFFSKMWVPGLFYFGYFLVGYVLYELHSTYGKQNFANGYVFASVILVKTLLFYFSIKGLAIDFLFASMIVAVVIFSPNVSIFFCNKLFRWLGKISFPLYLVHVPIICSLGMYTFVKLAEYGIGAELGAILCFLIVMLISLIVANFLTFVDTGTLKFLKVMKRKFGIVNRGKYAS